MMRHEVNMVSSRGRKMGIFHRKYMQWGLERGLHEFHGCYTLGLLLERTENDLRHITSLARGFRSGWGQLQVLLS